MRKLAATFALLLIFGSVAYAGSDCPKECNRPERASNAWTDPIPPAGISASDDGLPWGMYAQVDDDDMDDTLNPPPGGPMGIGRGHWRGMQRGRERIETFRTVRLLELLNLGDDNEVKFLEIYRAYRKDYRDLKAERIALVDSLADGLRGGNLKDKQIAQMIRQSDSLDEQGVRMTEDFYSQVRPVLTEAQMGKLYVFQERFEAELLERIREFRRGHDGMPPGPGMRRPPHNNPDMPEDSLR